MCYVRRPLGREAGLNGRDEAGEPSSSAGPGNEAASTSGLSMPADPGVAGQPPVRARSGGGRRRRRARTG